MYMWKSSLQGSDGSGFAAFLSDCAKHGSSYREAFARWLPGDWSAKGADVTALQLQRLLDRSGLSQRSAAKALEINERSMRRYCSGEQPVPKAIELALLYLASQANPGGKYGG